MCRSKVRAFFLLIASAMLVRGRSFAVGQGAQRWPPRMPGSRRSVGKLQTGDGVAESGAESGEQHGQQSPFLALSTAEDVAFASSSAPRRKPLLVAFTGKEGAPPSLASGLSVLSIVAVEVALGAVFHLLEWSFPSSVAGMISLVAGLAALDRASPPRAERLTSLLEPGSTQIMAWLPLIFVPLLSPWSGLPLTELMGSFESLPEAVILVAKLGGILGSYPELTTQAGATARAGAGAGGTKIRLVTNVTKLLLTVGGGCLMTFVSAAALFTALSPSSSSPAPSSALSIAGADVADAGTPPRETSRAARAPLVFSDWQHVRWLGKGMFASGAVSVASFVTMFLAFRVESRYDSRFVLFLLLSIPGFYGAALTLGLAAAAGFAAGRAALSSWALFGRPYSPWTAMLLPVAPSALATIAAAVTLEAMTWMGIPLQLCGIHADSMHRMLGNTSVLPRLLGPAVLSFAPPLFRMRGLIFSHARQIIGGSIACASTTLFGIALGSRLLGVPKAFNTMLHAKSPNTGIAGLSSALRFMSPWHRRKVLPSNAITVASALGFYAPPMIAGVMALTGVLGASVGPRILDAMGVKDPMTRGLIQGGTLNVFGVAASYQESAGEEPTTTTTTTETTTLTRDVSTATMILTGVAGTVLVNIPVIRSLLLSIALGSTTAGSVVPLPDDAFMRQR